ncbi:MAG: YvcK family protein, partial [Candidatus Dormibacteraeota bacterium]|nr:YvcK family protein [Candidatus Dormibacteraeota bacterium]
MKLSLLAGGTGAARLARGLAATMPPQDLSVITNTADDDDFWGLLVCPDTDSVLYRLAGVFNESAGFGVRDESFHALEMLQRLGEASWFGLGDRDIGVHLLRHRLLGAGARLTEAVAALACRFGIATAVIPMSDDRVRTRIATDSGELSLQSWFVQYRCEPPFRGCRFEGIETATASPEAISALQHADAIVIGPSNPVISIDPILALLRPHLVRERVVAVSPLVGGRSLKGPTVEMLLAEGGEATALTVARRYADI